MRDDKVYLRHILEAVRRIEEDVGGGREPFMASHMAQDAVLRNLQTLAESSQRLSEAAKGTRADVEWRRISAFRNVLVHNYLGIDIEMVWEIVQRDLPPLKRAVAGMLAEPGQASSGP